MPVMTNDEVAEVLIVLHVVSDFLRTIDEPVPGFALRGVAEALQRSIEPRLHHE